MARQITMSLSMGFYFFCDMVSVASMARQITLSVSVGFFCDNVSASILIFTYNYDPWCDGVAQLVEHRLEIQRPAVRTPSGALGNV